MRAFPHALVCASAGALGAIAQLVERLVRNEKVRGSNPLSSTGLFPVRDAMGGLQLRRNWATVR